MLRRVLSRPFYLVKQNLAALSTERPVKSWSVSTSAGEIKVIQMDHRPANVLNGAMLSQIIAALKAADTGPEEGIILTGTEGMFSAGFDLKFVVSLDRLGMQTFWRLYNDAVFAIASSKKPIVSAISGHSPGGACALILASGA